MVIFKIIIMKKMIEYMDEDLSRCPKISRHPLQVI